MRRGLAQALELGLEGLSLGDGVEGLHGRAAVVLRDQGQGLRVAQALTTPWAAMWRRSSGELAGEKPAGARGLITSASG